MSARILVAGLGNVFLGDDGFGVEVARRLGAERLPEGVEVADFGIRGVHLAFEILDGAYDAVVLLDAAARGDPPGTLTVIEPDAPESSELESSADGHALDPWSVVRLLQGWRARGVTVAPQAVALASDPAPDDPAVAAPAVPPVLRRHERLLVVTCEPRTIEEGVGLSEVVARAASDAVPLVRRLLDELAAAGTARVGAATEPLES